MVEWIPQLVQEGADINAKDMVGLYTFAQFVSTACQRLWDDVHISTHLETNFTLHKECAFNLSICSYTDIVLVLHIHSLGWVHTTACCQPQWTCLSGRGSPEIWSCESGHHNYSEYNSECFCYMVQSTHSKMEDITLCLTHACVEDWVELSFANDRVKDIMWLTSECIVLEYGLLYFSLSLYS